MASDPNALPESIILGQFAGVRNTVARNRLGQGDLEQALNIDIDDVGQARRRRGYSLGAAGAFHSVRNVGTQVYGVKDGVLGVIGADLSFRSLAHVVGAEPLSYTRVADTTYFSSLTASGKIVDDTVLPWGAATDDGTWLSPVITPTTTLGELFGRQITAPPMASEIEAHNGRIYLGAGRYVWATELYLYDYTDRTRNFLQFEEEITMIVSSGDGLYVGTTANLWFLKGTLGDGLVRTNVIGSGVLKGSAVTAPTADVHPSNKAGPVPEGTCTIFMTTDGICAAFERGEVHNLTRGRVVFPGAVGAAALYREDSGVSSYVAVADSAGGPATNARIGDFVDAEIVRRGG